MSSAGVAGFAQVSFKPNSAVAETLWVEPGESLEGRRHLSAQFQSLGRPLVSHPVRFEIASLCTGHQSPLIGRDSLSSRRKVSPRLLE